MLKNEYGPSSERSVSKTHAQDETLIPRLRCLFARPESMIERAPDKQWVGSMTDVRVAVLPNFALTGALAVGRRTLVGPVLSCSPSLIHSDCLLVHFLLRCT